MLAGSIDKKMAFGAGMLRGTKVYVLGVTEEVVPGTTGRSRSKSVTAVGFEGSKEGEATS